MILELGIRNTASYNDAGQVMNDLGHVNYIYGPNGSGKTTISRLVDAGEDRGECSVKWSTTQKLDTRVYNEDFIRQNFSESNLLKGIFTLGEEDTELLENIASTRSELDELGNRRQKLEETRSGEDGNAGKEGELETLIDGFRDRCWTYKRKYEEIFKAALKGHIGSKKDFAAELRKQAQISSAELISYGELVDRSKSVFAEDVRLLEPIQTPDVAELLLLEESPILRRKLVGKEDVDISAMIEKLGNSDWVRNGREYFAENEGWCPFCQQKTTESFALSLNEYFDEAFASGLDEVSQLATDYKVQSADVRSKFEQILESGRQELDQRQFSSDLDLLVERLNANGSLIARKQREPSTEVQLKDVSELTNSLLRLVEDANSKVVQHNLLVENKNSERMQLRAEIWRYIAEEAKSEITNFNHRVADLEKAIANIDTQLDELSNQYTAKHEKLRGYERQITSVKPTVDAINKILVEFGFDNFRLAEAEESGFYKIVRPDGTDAHRTLSEGERTFITFLYFYHWLRGSTTESDVKRDRVVVFDDPVSSLDSEILFIVSSLIRDIIEGLASDGPIKQIFLLTHNIYFFKEVTFRSQELSGKEVSHCYWVVNKREGISQVERHNESPVKSAYQMLWDEIKKPEASRHTIRNSIRRILEYYFNTIGNVNLNKLPDYFKGDEKIICKSMIAWVHEGSHFTDDDLTVVPSIETVDRQLEVFKKVFENTNHQAHYEMMMGPGSKAI